MDVEARVNVKKCQSLQKHIGKQVHYLKIRVTTNKVNIFISIFLMMTIPII